MTKRLYKKGDKIVITLTVTEDAGPQDQHVWTVAGNEASLMRSIEVLDTGVLTPAYIPKVGDRFRYASAGRLDLSWDSQYENVCLFVDDTTIVMRSYRTSGPALTELKLSNVQFKRV